MPSARKASSAEQEIRDAVVIRCRELWPDARIVHELNVQQGAARIDIAAVTPRSIYMFEIKSKNDTLKRLQRQVQKFYPACHELYVVAHHKWTDYPPTIVTELPNGGTRHQRQKSKLELEIKGTYRANIWTYPETGKNAFRNWRAGHRDNLPWSKELLSLLWRDELEQVCVNFRVSATKRSPIYKMIPLMVAQMTGDEIARGVCQCLRARQFAEADEPVTGEIDITTRTSQTLFQ